MRLRNILIAFSVLIVLLPVLVAIDIYRKQGWAPPIAGNAALAFGTPSVEWTKKLLGEFPLGTLDQTVFVTLAAQGFVIDDDPDSSVRTGSYSWNSFPCSYTLWVEWRVNDKKRIEHIHGNYGAVCP